ncbi:uncharacterized protein LOC118482622 [Helianthus annuus]|uniref:uncharacterized protein LOC118482622 n=1 Tax=Helianthus annuus TaxID=4232 RepID=UPI0016532DAE|nr:uncharacterized protein LOC118482622 [Helianthus annuus]
MNFSQVLKNGSFVCFALQDPLKNDLLAVQTIRNNIMSSTLLATTTITLNVNHGCLFCSIDLRELYFLFLLFSWILGPIPMFMCCSIIMLSG